MTTVKHNDDGCLAVIESAMITLTKLKCPYIAHKPVQLQPRAILSARKGRGGKEGGRGKEGRG